MAISTSTSHNQSSVLQSLHASKAFQSKELLPLQLERLWRIEAGVVRSLTWDAEGKTTTLGFWGKGDVVGQPLSRIKPYQVECLTAVQVYEILPEDQYLNTALLTHAWKSEELLSILHHSSAVEQLLKLLKWLAHQFGHPTPYGVLLNLGLTHQDFADTLGMTRITITRLFNQLEREGKVQRFTRVPVTPFYQQLEKLSRQSLIVKTA
jgi:CRP-like cAMP-binding protein